MCTVDIYWGLHKHFSHESHHSFMHTSAHQRLSCIVLSSCFSNQCLLTTGLQPLLPVFMIRISKLTLFCGSNQTRSTRLLFCNRKSRFSKLKHAFYSKIVPPKISQLVGWHPYDPGSILNVSESHVGTHSTEIFSPYKRIVWVFLPVFSH